MGIVEMTLRNKVRVGDAVDVTLIGGRELRGRITAFYEDGFLMSDRGYERPVAFAGVATFLPTSLVQPDWQEAQAPAQQPAPEAAQPAVEETETVTQEEGWVERFDAAAGVGSIVIGDQHAVFAVGDVLDQQLADQLAAWFGRAIPVQCTLHVKGALRKATSITGRSTPDKYRKPEKAAKSAPQPAERHGFGEIIHFDKQGGFGKAREGDVKFLFKREDISSDALWKEIIQSANTCGIKVAFTAVSDGKRVRYTRIRELSALQTPDSVEKPDFTAVIPVDPEEDVNPLARVEFTDGSTLEEEELSGYVMFYNADKHFGRLQQENGERYYFRETDIMQKTLLDFLCTRPDVADTAVTFSVKHLPTGKTAAGRVKWNAPRPTPRAARPAPAPEKPAAPAPREEPPAKRAEELPLNRYCENLSRLWHADRPGLAERLRAEADGAQDESVRRDLLLESVALSDVLREKRDDAMLRYLRAFVREGGGSQLDAFLTEAAYAGSDMFDALTALFAVSDGAYSRLCGLIASGDMVTLRGEILARFGQVPETAQGLRDLWRPLIEAERARTAYANLLPAKGALEGVTEPERSRWERVLDALEARANGTLDAAQAAELARTERTAISARPLRMAVEWMLPLLEQLEAGAPGLNARAVALAAEGGAQYAVIELLGSAKHVRAELDGASIELSEAEGLTRIALPCAQQRAELRLTWEGGSAVQELEFAAVDVCTGDARRALEKMEDCGVAVLRGGSRAVLDAAEALLCADERCAVVRVDAAGQDAAGVLRCAYDALRGSLTRRYGEQTIGLFHFPAPEAAEKMDADALRAELKDTLTGFGDMRLIHDGLKDAHIAMLVDAAVLTEAGARFALAMTENGVRAIIAAAQSDAPAELVLDACPDRLEDTLQRAGHPGPAIRRA